MHDSNVQYGISVMTKLDLASVLTNDRAVEHGRENLKKGSAEGSC